jgi:phytoene synthase
VKGETRAAFPAAAASVSASGLSPVACLVRDHDHDRFATVLFAPAARREALFALYAFNYEIARVREIVSEVLLGRIRLQWWREALDESFAGGVVRRHVVALPLAAAIRERGLSRAPFERLLEARERDLYAAPPASLAELETYADDSSAALIELALEILGVRRAEMTDVARDVGIAYGLAGLLRAMAVRARAGHPTIPQALAAECGLDPEDYAALRTTPALRAAAAAIAAAASGRLAASRAGRAHVPRAALPALLPAVTATVVLKRLERAGYDPFAPALAAADPLLAWRFAAAVLRRRF